MEKVTAPTLIKMKQEGRKITVLTAYSYSMARLLDEAQIPVLLVGDSCGMVEAGSDSTLPVTVDEIIYHTRSVARACKSALVVADMPFMSYEVSAEEAVKNAGRLVKEGGAEAVKLEGGSKKSIEAIEAIVEAGIPVMGHLGLTPQSVLKLGGYKVQGRGDDAGTAMVEEARAVEAAGSFSVVLECVPEALAKRITEELTIPTIGIGAGISCDGQVLVINDILGLDATVRLPKFVKKYAELSEVILKAASDFKEDVESGIFPAKEHSY